MRIAKENPNRYLSTYLDINSEVLLLAFEPEEREVSQKDLTELARPVDGSVKTIV